MLVNLQIPQKQQYEFFSGVIQENIIVRNGNSWKVASQIILPFQAYFMQEWPDQKFLTQLN